MWFQKTDRLFAKSIQNAMTWSHCIDESGKSDIWTFSTDVVGQGHRKSGQLCLNLVRRDRQTMDSLFYKNLDRIAPPDRIFRHRTGFSTKCIIQFPTLNSYGQIGETKYKNWDITKRYLRKQAFAEARISLEKNQNVRLKLEILIETGPPIIYR